VDAELRHLGLAGPRPAFKFFAERGPSSNPRPGAIVTLHYRYGLRDGDRVVGEVGWTLAKYPPGGPIEAQGN
jgi:hypothetical protein